MVVRVLVVVLLVILVAVEVVLMDGRGGASGDFGCGDGESGVGCDDFACGGAGISGYDDFVSSSGCVGGDGIHTLPFDHTTFTTRTNFVHQQPSSPYFTTYPYRPELA